MYLLAHESTNMVLMSTRTCIRILTALTTTGQGYVHVQGFTRRRTLHVRTRGYKYACKCVCTRIWHAHKCIHTMVCMRQHGRALAFMRAYLKAYTLDVHAQVDLTHTNMQII